MSQQQGNKPQPSQDDHERAENLRTLLEQHWLHARHVESERAWFMSVYATITGGVLAYISGTATMRALWPLYFLIVFSLVGLFLTIRWTQAFQYHRKCVEITAQDLGLDVDLEIPTKHVFKILRTRYLFPLFYLFVFVALLILLIAVARG